MQTVLVGVAIIVLGLFGFAGGGGSGSGGGGGGGGGGGSSSSSGSDSESSCKGLSGEALAECEFDNMVVGLICLGIIGIIVVLAMVFGKKGSQGKKRDYTPDEQKTIEQANKIFMQYQTDWTKFDTKHMAGYMSKNYHAHAGLMMEALENMHRQNRVSDVKIINTYIPEGSLNTEFTFSGLDELVDTKTDKTLLKQHASNVQETWRFVKQNGKLVLDGINQPTESAPHLSQDLAKFATDNKMHYSPDWGRYLLPDHGLIFNPSSLTSSDVNNHIIGKWKDILVQMYTYALTPGEPNSYFVVAQLTVPKHYTGIIVRNKKLRSHRPPKGYEKYSTEWTDFNKNYEVFAADPDKVTTFELLNPKFMADLHDSGLTVSIETIDNVIYLYTRVGTPLETYQKMLDILAQAHKELKM